MQKVTPLYIAQATSTGGRDGTSRSSDGKLEVKLSTPKSWVAQAVKAPTPSKCSPLAIRPASSAH